MRMKAQPLQLSQVESPESIQSGSNAFLEFFNPIIFGCLIHIAENLNTRYHISALTGRTSLINPRLNSTKQ